ncbi:hypothetical protein DYB28_005512 [Aphanomyces astaci]|uniref:Uncharacterized protein n=1 Tax=Aphanomyces astaci TaxID=112090 RepID=A0A9X8HBJ8_APHAT|nr:hypothetical protein DYB28_005512 [Aphanomyces astaci]
MSLGGLPEILVLGQQDVSSRVASGKTKRLRFQLRDAGLGDSELFLKFFRRGESSVPILTRHFGGFPIGLKAACG